MYQLHLGAIYKENLSKYLVKLIIGNKSGFKKKFITSPVSNKIGFGAWQFSCSSSGFFNNPETKSQNGLLELAPVSIQ